MVSSVVAGSNPDIFGGIPVSQPVTGGDWLSQALNAAVQVSTARYAAKYAGAIAQQNTLGAAIPQDGNTNAVTGYPGYTAGAGGVSAGFSVSQDTLIVGAMMLGVVLLAVAFE